MDFNEIIRIAMITGEFGSYVHIYVYDTAPLLDIFRIQSILCSEACLPSSYQAKSQLYCRPNGPAASIFYGI